MRRTILALVLVSLLGAPGAAGAAGPGGVALEPSRIEAVVGRGESVPPITITNNTRGAVAVVARPYPATQALTGMPEYETGAAARAAGARLLRIDRDRFVLAPGASRKVAARLVGCPQTGLGTYAVVEFGVMQAAGAASRSQVTSKLQLVAPLLIESPARPCLDARLTDLRAEQAGKGKLTFFATVGNAGNLHVRPETSLQLRRGGRTVFEGAMPAENVIPRARREFALPLTGRLPAGSYRAVARSEVDGRVSRLSRTIRLTGVNTLPTPKLSLEGLQVRDARTGASPVVTGTVRSTGTAVASGTVQVAIRRSGSGAPSDTRTVAIERLAPGEEQELSVRLQPLARGGWSAEAVVKTAGRETDRADAGFTVAAEGVAATARWRDWAATHVDALLGLMVAALAFTALTAAGLARRRRRGAAPAGRSSDELAEIRAALARMEAEATRRRAAAGSRAASAPRPPDAGVPGFVVRSEPAPPPPPPPPPAPAPPARETPPPAAG